MKTVVYYAAPNPKGSSAQIVERLAERFKHALAKGNVAGGNSPPEVADYDLVILVVATYGDQEVQDNMESFITSVRSAWAAKPYVVCELGNYYGYDDYTFGSGAIIDGYLQQQGAIRKWALASIDTLPQIDWKAVDKWIDRLNNAL